MKRNLGAAIFQALWDLGFLGRIVILVFLGFMFGGFAYLAFQVYRQRLRSHNGSPRLPATERLASFGFGLVLLALSAIMGFNLVRLVNNWITGAPSPL